MPTSFDFSASFVELLRLRTNPRTRADTRMNELGLSESESLSGRKNIGTIVEERVPDSLWFCSLLIDWFVGGWWFMMIHACWVVHVEFIQSLMRRVALIFWSISSRWIRSSGIPRPEDSKRSVLPTKLESKFDQILVSFCTEAAAWCWYKAFGPLLVFLNGTSSRNVQKTCEESCILSSDAQCTIWERK